MGLFRVALGLFLDSATAPPIGRTLFPSVEVARLRVVGMGGGYDNNVSCEKAISRFVRLLRPTNKRKRWSKNLVLLFLLEIRREM